MKQARALRIVSETINEAIAEIQAAPDSERMEYAQQLLRQVREILAPFVADERAHAEMTSAAIAEVLQRRAAEGDWDAWAAFTQSING